MSATTVDLNQKMSTPPEAKPDFDPRSVPSYPIVRLVGTIGESDDAMEWTLDGAPVQLDEHTPKGLLREAAMQKASSLARPIKAVRARLIAGETFDYVVTADGQVWDLKATAVPDDDADRNRRRASYAVFAGMGLVATLLLGGTAAAVLSHRSSPEQQTAAAPPSAQPIQLPALNPPGTSRIANWASPNLATVGSGIGMTYANNSLVTITEDNRLVGLDPTTGAEKWSSPAPTGVVSGPMKSRVDGTEVLAVATSQSIVVWPLTGSATGETHSLPTGAVAVIGPGGIYTTYSDRHRADILVKGQLLPRVLPAGAKPLGVDQQALIAVDDAGHLWRVTDERVAPDPANLIAPSNVAPLAALTLANGRLLTLWRDSGSGMVVTTAYAIADLKPLWAAQIASKPGLYMNTVPPSQVSPDGSWLVVAGTAFDIADGRFVDLGETWQPQQVTDAGAISYDQHWAPKLAAPAALPVVTGQGQRREAFALPQQTDAAHVYVAATDGSKTRIYALPKEH